MRWFAALLIPLLVAALTLSCEEEEEGEVAAPPSDSPAAQKLERIVQAAPGAVAEAEGVRITLNEVADPWVSDSMFARPASGRRFVAFDVTIEQVGGSHLASQFKFQLTDAEGFAYDPELFSGPEPDLRSIDLGKGQKTRGWVTFEVSEGTPLKLLKYDPELFTTKDIEFQW